jgi:hypothetical protein
MSGMSNHTDSDNSRDPAAGAPETDRGAEGRSREMLIQLQQMIDAVAAQAGPVLRDVAAKAAELAALAAERTGPIAHRAADVTERVSVRVAARTKEVAEDLRRQQAEEQAREQAQADDAGMAGVPAPDPGAPESEDRPA